VTCGRTTDSKEDPRSYEVLKISAAEVGNFLMLLFCSMILVLEQSGRNLSLRYTPIPSERGDLLAPIVSQIVASGELVLKMVYIS